MVWSGFVVGILILLGVGIVIILFLDEIFESLQKLINKIAGKLYLKQSYSEQKLKSFKDYMSVVLNVAMALLVAAISFGNAINGTLLNCNFMQAQAEALDVEAIGEAAKELVSRSLHPQQQQINVALDSTVQELEPWLKEQACSIVQQSYDYFLRKKTDLNISISLEPVHESLRKNLENNLLNSPELKDATPDQVKSTIDYTYFSAFGGIPKKFVLSSTSSSPETITTLKQVTQFVLWYQIAFWLFIVLLFIIIFLIVRLSSDFQVATKLIGMNLFCGGLLGFIYSFVIIEVVKLATNYIELSSSQSWLIKAVGRTIAATRTPNIIVFVSGIFIFLLAFIIPYYWRLKKAKVENLCQPPASKAESN